MSQSIRVTWLSALALVVPCALIGTLAYQWLALEREVAARRGLDAAQVALTHARQRLDRTARGRAAESARVLVTPPRGAGPLAPTAGLPAGVIRAFMFDASGRLLEPSALEGCDQDVERYQSATRDSAWQQQVARIRVLEDGRRLREAAQEASSLVELAGSSADRLAQAFMMSARVSAADGDLAGTRSTLSKLLDCCASVRDEYGVSFAMYAAWQRLSAALVAADPRAQLASIAHDLRDLIDRGYLGQADDAAEVRLLAQRAAGDHAIASLVPAIDRARGAIEERALQARQVAQWLARVPQTAAGSDVRYGRLASGDRDSILAAADVDEGHRVAMVLDSASLSAWIGPSTTIGEPFDVSVRPVGPQVELTPLDVPLSVEPDGLLLTASARAVDPTADRRREWLFLTAISAALVMSLGVGVLAMRDVSREARMASLRSAFVAGVTHELKTPLTSIRLLADTLRQGRARPEQAAGLLDTVAHEAERVSHLIDNVLSSSRIESGLRVYTRKRAIVQDVVASAIARCDYLLDSNGFSLERSFSPDPLGSIVDADALEQAVLNLLSNAVKYSGAKSKVIRVGVEQHGAEVQISVLDHGIGIAPTDLPRVFERFYRAPSVESDTVGAGLGLSLVKHFAEAHGGRVTVSSESNPGSTFTIHLPRASG